MAFVSAYEHDVFISYARVDNAEMPNGGKSVRWISEMKDILQKFLDERLGRTDSCKIWMDLDDLRGNESVTPTLSEAVTRTATMLVFLSPGYTNSPWCRQELKGFSESGLPGRRIFVVCLRDLPLEERPLEIQDLNSYLFYDQKTKLKLSPKSTAYGQRLSGLADDLSDLLREMKDCDGHDDHQKCDETESPAVYIAEVLPALKNDRSHLQKYVESLGYRVLPTAYYRRGLEDYRSGLEQDLNISKLFVQILGEYVSNRTEDFPDGYEGFQLELARTANIPLLRSYPRDRINVGDIIDDLDRRFIEAPDVMALDLEEFKMMIKKKLDDMNRYESDPDDSVKQEKVIINAFSEDKGSADQVIDQLYSGGVPYSVLDENDKLGDFVSRCKLVGFVLVYGSRTDPKWIRQQMQSFNPVCMDIQKLEKQQPNCALYLDPPERRKSLLDYPPPPVYETIDSSSVDTQLKRFIDKLKCRMSCS